MKILQQQGQQWQTQRRYHQCIKGCGNEIYFDANNKSQSGKYISSDKNTHQKQAAKETPVIGFN